MTDQEKLLELLHSWGIEPTVYGTPKTVRVLIDRVEALGKWCGGEKSNVEFVFDLDGNFMGMGAWE